MQTYTAESSELSSGKESVLMERQMASPDGWRGVAILTVFFRHYTVTTQERYGCHFLKLTGLFSYSAEQVGAAA